MASGLRAHQPKNYRAILGLKPQGSGARKSTKLKKTPAPVLQSNMVDIEGHILRCLGFWFWVPVCGFRVQGYSVMRYEILAMR